MTLQEFEALPQDVKERVHSFVTEAVGLVEKYGDVLEHFVDGAADAAAKAEGEQAAAPQPGDVVPPSEPAAPAPEAPSGEESAEAPAAPEAPAEPEAPAADAPAADPAAGVNTSSDLNPQA